MIPIAITEATFNAVAASQWAISARRRARSGYKLGNHFIWLEPRWSQARRDARPRRELLGRDHLAGGGWTRVAERVLTRKPRLVVYFSASTRVLSSRWRG